MARIVRLCGDSRAVDDLHPRLSKGEYREEHDEENPKPGDGAIYHRASALLKLAQHREPAG